MSADVLGLLGGGVVLATGFSWFRLIQRVAVPDNRLPWLAAMAVGVALGAGAFVNGPGWLGAIAGGFALLVGGMFIGLRFISAQPVTTPAVAVGQPIPDFTLPDHRGEAFSLSQISGKPFLLKFFRGHW
jgi:hypothetical protein